MILSKATAILIRAAMHATTILGSGVGVAKMVALFQNDLEPTPETLLADLTLANFDGYAALAMEESIANSGTNPLTGNHIVTVKEPVGGIQFETSGVTNLPQTIYGCALLNDTETAIVGIQRFETPIVLTEANQIINIPSLSTEFSGDDFI